MTKNVLKNPVFQLFLALGAVILGSSAVLAQFYGYYPQYGYGTQYSGYSPYNNGPYGSSCPTVSRDLSLGSTDSAFGDSSVTSLQSFLLAQNLGVGNLVVSGYYDVNTQSAVAIYQSRNGITPTGTVGPQTRSAIAAACSTYGAYNSYQNDYQNWMYQPYGNNPYSSGAYQYTGQYPNNLYGYNQYGSQYTYPYTYTNSYNSAYQYSGQNQYSQNYPYYGYNSTPTITSLSNSSGTAGQIVTIVGSGFAPSGNIVQFGGISITDQQLSSSNGTTLSFRVPATFFPSNCSFNCSSQLIAPGSYDISVSSGTSGVRSNSLPFVLTTNSPFFGGQSNQQFNQTFGGLITSVNGPSSLALGSTGTWTVTVNNTTGGQITLLARWGDELQSGFSSTFSSVQTVSNPGVQTLTFTHTYNQRGTFPILFNATAPFGFTNGSVNSTVTVF
ncbi:MAG: peptidoglycan-binding protein [Patescibacteria group bacterium]